MKFSTPFESLESRTFMSITPGSVVHPPTTPTPHIAVPASVTAPTTLTVKAFSSTEVFLTWSGDTGATMYTIQQSTNGKTGWNNIGVRTPGNRSFMQSNVTGHAKYFYRIVVAGNGGAVAFSSVVSVFV